jgi:hypothetical protein
MQTNEQRTSKRIQQSWENIWKVIIAFILPCHKADEGGTEESSDHSQEQSQVGQA